MVVVIAVVVVDSIDVVPIAVAAYVLLVLAKKVYLRLPSLLLSLSYLMFLLILLLSMKLLWL